MASSLAIIENVEQKDVVAGILAQRIAKVNFHENHRNQKCEMIIARVLIPKGADINKRDGPAQRTLASTLFQYNPTIEMLKVLKEAGADFKKSTIGNNFLHDMVYIDDSSDVPKLIEFLVNGCGCDVNRPNYRGETPLKGAIAYSRIDVVKKLIECGADINCLDEYDETPFEVACVWDRAEIVKIFIEYGVDSQFRDKNNKTCLHVAAKHGAPKVTKLLIDSGADVNAKDKSGKTPLHFAKTDEVVKVLFSNGAIVDLSDKDGNTPIYDALSRNNTNKIDELLKCGADIQDTKFFKLTLDKYYSGKDDINDYNIFPYMKRYFVKLTALGFYDISPSNFDDDLQKLFLECQAEVELLETSFFDDCTSLHQLLHKNRNRRCVYADNENLKNLVEGATIERLFPNYFILILGCYNDAASRKSLLERATHALFQATKIYFADLCFDKIFMHLVNADILRFLEACENENINDSTNLPTS